MQNLDFKKEVVLEKINKIEKIGIFTDCCSIVIIILIASSVFVGYFTQAIESNYLRLSVYIIVMIIFFWLLISTSLVLLKKKVSLQMKDL
jgi:hypothetical protein